MKKLLLTTALVAMTAGIAHANPTTTYMGDTYQLGNATTQGTATSVGLAVNRNIGDPDSPDTFSVDSGTNTTTANGTFNSTGLTNTNNLTNEGFINNIGNFSTRATDYQETTDTDTGVTSYTSSETDTVANSGGFSIRYEGESGSWDADGWVEEPDPTVSRLTVGPDGVVIEGGLNVDRINGNNTLGDVNEFGEGISSTTINGDLTIIDADGNTIDVDNTLLNNSAAIGTNTSKLTNVTTTQGGGLHVSSDVSISGTLTVGGQQITSGAAGKDGAAGANGRDGRDGANGRDGADGQDARINVNSAGQYVVSDSSGKSVTVATDEQVTLTKDELTALIQSVAATATASLAAESEARIEEIQAEAEARIEALTVAAEERLAIKTLAVSNTVSIVALEDQW